ncbi:MAG: acyl-ACP--UDP-N-acetylglucosamine O-acyltransferase [Candidatus Rokubacteria bacterium]|nr:acyl-ACP--UDP-N-acetylglucosamine O-acyltransferase [Candidatus Rokubacteria bacterium]
MGAPDIHPTAVVDPKARLGAGVRIGAHSVVGPEVELGDGVELGHHAILEGRVLLGPRVKVGHGTALGGDPQDLKFKSGTPSGVRVGAGTVFREYVTVHRASHADAFTEIGAGCFLMTQCHVGHDCRVGDGVILVNGVQISGHCEIGERATLGGLVGVVQFCRVGTYAYIGGCAKITRDIPPFVIADGYPARAYGVNVVGLRRAGMTPADRRALQEAYRLLYRGGLPPPRAVERIRGELPATPHVDTLLRFIETSKRGICAGARAAEVAAAESEPVV